MPELPDPAALLPHSGPARLVTGVLEVGVGHGRCTGRIPPDSPFVRDGRAPAYLALELAAQAAAVLEAIARLEAGSAPGPRVGYLVGVREARLAANAIPVGAELHATVRLEGSAPPLAIYAVRVVGDGVEYLAGTVSTYAPGGPARPANQGDTAP